MLYYGITNTSTNMNGQVYILKIEGQDFYKIGITAGKISDRIATLQTGNPKQICHIYHGQVKDELALENYLHQLFKYAQLKGEWFELTYRDVEIIISIIQAEQLKYIVDKLQKQSSKPIKNLQKKSQTERLCTKTANTDRDLEYLEYLPVPEKLIQMLEKTELSLPGFVRNVLKVTTASNARRAKRAIVGLVKKLDRTDLWDKFELDKFTDL